MQGNKLFIAYFRAVCPKSVRIHTLCEIDGSSCHVEVGHVENCHAVPSDY